METKDLVLGGIIIVLLLTTIVYGVRSGTHAAETDEAAAMTEALVTHLKAMEYSSVYPECRSIGPGRYTQLERCLIAAEEQTALTAMFREDDFRNFDLRKNASGYLVIENFKGGKTFASEHFSLAFNNEEVATGCTTPGDIAPGFTCRFDFDKPCEPGDNLEIAYEGVRTYLKTC